MAVFHSISAFCNAGFDILGTESNLYPSLTGYAGSPTINITIMLLIVVGGIGFLTWDDVCENKWRLHRYRMQSKVILVTTGLLFFCPPRFSFSPTFPRFLPESGCWHLFSVRYAEEPAAITQ